MAADGVIEVRRNARLAAAVGVAAFVVAALFVARGGALSILVGVVLLAVAGLQLWTAYDGRIPLLLVDEQGVRIRMGSTWRGMPWSQVHEIEHTPRQAGWRGWWRDGRLAVLPVDEAGEVAALEGRAGWHARLTERLYGVPFAVPLGASTRVSVAAEDLTAALAALAGPTTGIVEIDETLGAVEDGDTGTIAAVQPDEQVEEPEREDTNPRIARLPHVPDAPEDPSVEETVVPSATPAALREPTQVVRVDAVLAERVQTVGANALAADAADAEAEAESDELPEAAELRRTPEEEADHEAVIGAQLRASRERIGLGVDQLADRTRIRPHVIEAIEVDDFGPCGGDFYARGHLRTLARVLGLEAAPLLAIYDERYADAPVDPRAVFQAELASGDHGTLRRMKGGPNWSVLVAAVMAVVLGWSIVRLATAGTTEHTASPAISLESGSAGTTNPYGKLADPVPVTLNAAGGGAHVVIRDGSGAVVFTGDLAFGESKSFRISPPLRVQTSDGSLAVSVDGGPAAALGTMGQPAQKTYTAD